MANFHESTINAVGQSHENGLTTIAAGIVESFGVSDSEACDLAPRARHGLKMRCNLIVLQYRIAVSLISKADASDIVSRLVAEKWSWNKLSVEVHNRYATAK